MSSSETTGTRRSYLHRLFRHLSSKPQNPLSKSTNSHEPVGINNTAHQTIVTSPNGPSPTNQVDGTSLELKNRNGLVALTNNLDIESFNDQNIYPVDIVAVHGLNGHLLSTFKAENQQLWLRDFLPEEFPGARIYTYGYRSEIVSSRGTGEFDAFARNLLEALRSERSKPDQKRRPLIFICHSMGGIVVKKALNISVVEDDQYHDIRLSAQSIFFMATPHRGSNVASEAAVMARVANAVSLGAIRSGLVKSLERGSKELVNIGSDFRKQTQNMKFYSFIEEQAMLPGRGRIVDDDSGRLGVNNEAIISMVGRNHTNICKFSERTDPDYKIVLSRLREAVEEATELLTVSNSTRTFEDEQCLQSLSFPSLDNRYHQIHPAYRDTCRWILAHPKFHSWKQSTNGLLWIKGHPGTGKSTMMKFICQEMQSHSAVTAPQLVLLDFYFLGVGTLLQKSQLGLFRSLLHQAYSKFPIARALILKNFQAKAKDRGKVGEGWEWQLEDLKTLFLEVAVKIAKRKHVFLMVDALDEAVESLDETQSKSAQQLVDYFHYLNAKITGSRGYVKICISCRHYPNISIGTGVQISMEEENESDLRQFIVGQLRTHAVDWYSEERSCQANLVEGFVEKAAGQFLWASLRVPRVVKSLNDGEYTFSDVPELLQSETNETFDLYAKIIETDIEKSMRARAFYFLQWTCFSMRPLSLTELRCAMACDRDSVETGLKDIEASKLLVKSDAQMGKLAKSLSGGLATVRRNEDGWFVQFIHQTVLEYFRGTGLSAFITQQEGILSSKQIVGMCESQISDSCLAYLNLERVQRGINEWEKGDEEYFPFLAYATEYWPVHAAKAEHIGHCQAYKAELFETAPNLFESWMQAWAMLNQIRHRFSSRLYTQLPILRSSSTLIHVAATFNLPSVVDYLLRKGTNINQKGDDAVTALHLAAKCSDLTLVRFLVQSGSDIEARDYNDVSPLQYALAGRKDDIARFLIQEGACTDFESQTQISGINNTPLQAAAEAGNLELVRYLVEITGADVNGPDGGKKSGTPLASAAQYGHDHVVRYLITKGANVNQWGGPQGTALQHAILSLESGDSPSLSADSMSIIYLLLNAGANVNIQADTSGTPLKAAALKKRCDIALILLHRGANVNAPDIEDGSALQASAAHGNEYLQVVRFLLDNGADVNAKGGRAGNALHAAASNLFGDEVVELLLARGADIHSRGGAYGCPILAAAHGGNYKTIKQLIDRGLDVNIELDRNKGNALHHAAFFGGVDVFRLLVDNGASLNSRSWQGETVLETVVWLGDIRKVQYLLDRDRGIKSGSSTTIALGEWNYSRCLLKAATWGKVAVMRLLLERGADFPITKDAYQEAVNGAAMGGHKEMVQLLLETNEGRNIDMKGRMQVVEAAKGKKRVVQLLMEIGYM